MNKQVYILLIINYFLVSACGNAPEGVEHIVVKGSDTEVNLALGLAETYMMKDVKASIAVTGGGSGAGIAALINGKTDIANSSRPLKEEEYALAHARNIHPTATIFAMDALAVVANDQLPVDSLTVAQVGAIFRGEITNWREVGGPDMDISLYGRQSNSGTYVYFRDSVVLGEYSRNLKQMNGTAQMVEGIKNDPAGMGYVGVGYIVQKDGSLTSNIKVLDVKADEASPAASPLEIANVTSGIYPIVRPLFQYTNGTPRGKLRDFMLFSLSEQGQQIVLGSGYYPVSRKYFAQNEKVLNFQYAEASTH